GRAAGFPWVEARFPWVEARFPWVEARFPWVEARFTLRQYAAGVLQGQTQPAAGYGGTVLSWSRPELPVLPTRGLRPQLRDTATGALTDPGQGRAPLMFVLGSPGFGSNRLGPGVITLAYVPLDREWGEAGLVVI